MLLVASRYTLHWGCGGRVPTPRGYPACPRTFLGIGLLAILADPLEDDDRDLAGRVLLVLGEKWHQRCLCVE